MPPVSLLHCHRWQSHLGRQAVHASRSLSGWLRAGGGGRAGPASCACGGCFEKMPTPACAIGRSLGWGNSRVFLVATRQNKVCFPLVRNSFKRPPDWHQVSGASVVPPFAVRLPALSLRSSLHLMPVFRPSQALGGVALTVLGEDGEHSRSQARTSSAPRFRHRVRASRHDSSHPAQSRSGLDGARCSSKNKRSHPLAPAA